MDIGIVTSFYNGYDRFIPRWAESICRLTIKPSMVVMIASGPEEDPKNVQQAEEMFDRYGIRYVSGKLGKHQSMGHARNKAVEYCDTEWVMYLDADDTILSNAINVMKKYEKGADVICVGLKIVGARKNRKLSFTYASTQRQLQGKHCGSSHSPFRKKFWEMSPFITKNDYIEQVFKLGLAQKGARFVGTKEICTVYHSRKSGHNLNMTKAQWKECKAQTKKFVKEGVQYD